MRSGEEGWAGGGGGGGGVRHGIGRGGGGVDCVGSPWLARARRRAPAPRRPHFSLLSFLFFFLFGTGPVFPSVNFFLALEPSGIGPVQRVVIALS